MVNSSIFKRPHLYIGLTILTGMTGLCFQVIWQRYLIILLGSDSKASSIIVSFFLLGLALGYRFFGARTEKINDRYQLLKIYGLLEMAIGAYAILFQNYFEILREVVPYLPDSYLIDLGLSAAFILPPTFLMGATVPMLTKALPSSIDDINRTHAQIYGWNTFGAFLGCFVGVLVLIPAFGLHLSLILCGVIDIVVGALFVFNLFTGKIEQKETLPPQGNPTRLSRADCFLVSFFSGICILCLEIVLVRLMSLSAGSSHYIFPAVIGIFIAGLSFGSLKIPENISTHYLLRQIIFGAFFLAIVFLTIPYWPYWLSVFRTSLTTIPSNFAVYWFLVCSFVGVSSFFWLAPLARILPVTYSLLPKTAANYGELCGRIYFINTLGAFIGAVFLGNWALHFFSLETLFKLVIIILLLLSLMMSLRLRRALQQQKRTLLLLILPLLVILFGHWDRTLHGISLFRLIDPAMLSHVHGLFPNLSSLAQTKRLFLKDDPITTAYIGEKQYAPQIKGLMVATNGKSDSNTYSDYSTVTLLGLVPYLYALPQSDLRALVIGLGTGVTSGILGKSKDIQSVTTLEISPAIIDAQSFFSDHNFNLISNPKSKIIETDAFRFLSRSRDKFEIISAEPSNPWVVGIENLFTKEFYDSIATHLTDDGVFFQWIQGYETDSKIVLGIIQSLSRVFPSLTLFRIGISDYAILASKNPTHPTPKLVERLNEEVSVSVRNQLGLNSFDHILALRKYSSDQLKTILTLLPQPEHSLYYPWLGQYAMKTFFMKSSFTGIELHDFIKLRLFDQNAEHYKTIEALAEEAAALQQQCATDITKNFVCDQLAETLSGYRELNLVLQQKITLATVMPALSAYRRLRLSGFQRPLPKLLLQIHEIIRPELKKISNARFEAQNMIATIARELSDLLKLEQMDAEAEALQAAAPQIQLVSEHKLAEYRHLRTIFR